MPTVTGPASKDSHAGGTTFQPKLKASVTGMPSMNNTSENVRSQIMKLRMPSTGFGTDIQGAMTKAPKS